MNNENWDQISAFVDLFQFHKILLLVVGIGTLTFLTKFVSKSGTRLSGRFNAHRLLVSQIATVLNFFLYTLGTAFLFFAVLRPPKELMLATAGSAAVALGLALKDVVSSVVAGFILLFDRPFQVGDRVTFGDIYGEVKTIGLRAVRLVTLDDNVVTIPNSKFITEAVASGNAGALDMMIVMDFHVAMDADIQLARKLLFDTVVSSRFVYLKKPVTVVIEEVHIAERLAIRLKVKAYVLDVRFEKMFQTDVFVRGNAALNEHRVKRPSLGLGTKFEGGIDPDENPR